MRIGGIVGALAVLALAACGGSTTSAATSSASVQPRPVATSAVPATASASDSTIVDYAYHDSSVPPAYHRSVTLTVTEDQARIVIDSYGDVLADKTVPTPPAVWEQLMSTSPSIALLTYDDLEGGCPGGTGITLSVKKQGRQVVDLNPQFCGDTNSGVESQINAWLAPARDLFPPTEELAPVSQQ